ncbi:MAG: DEAD/DEAH box helicase [Planctomycetaceae bacterium]|nr:DEAD/DEAH box helicase [Planctomycetaceae bacterium]
MTELTRDEIAEKYLETIPYSLYPVQEEALLAWFSSKQGILVCAPTGTGKTLIAEAAVFEALTTGKRTYYTTPLIALTDQKFRELQESAVRWGFSANDIGLVTGNHKVNPEAKVLVVVAEILFNRLLHPEDFDDFQDVHSVVMDEFHNFNDPERGIVWEFSLALLPPHVRLLLLSATVGNAGQFANWLEFEHQHKLEVVQSEERKVPLVFQWVGDQTLVEQIQLMCLGNEEERMTPALVFCFNRDECWRVAEEIRGKDLITPEVKSRLMAELARFDWSQGAGPKLKQLLVRGVGVHHAGILPKYRRVVEYLFQQKLLAVCTCTETLSAGINLPARSVVLPSIMKGPAGKQSIIDPGSAHQIFGRAGRPQFDTQGHVFVLCHEDDVQILRWQEKFNRLPADSKDPKILAEKKALKRKQPKRNPNIQYWSEQQFNKLRSAPAGNLESKGLVPWRMLAFMLHVSPEVERLRELVKKRLLFGKKMTDAQYDLEKMLGTLWSANYVKLEPEPPEDWFPSLPRPDREKMAVSAPPLPEKEEIFSVSREESKADHENAERIAEGNETSDKVETSAGERAAGAEKTGDEKGIRLETSSRSKGTPSLEMWKISRAKGSDGPAISVPKAAKKHVSKPKQTGFGVGLFDDLAEEEIPEGFRVSDKGKNEEAAKSVFYAKPKAKPVISLLDWGKKEEKTAEKKDDSLSGFHYEKSQSGFGSGLLGDFETDGASDAVSENGTEENLPETKADSARNISGTDTSLSSGSLLAGLTLGGGIQPASSKKKSVKSDIPKKSSSPVVSPSVSSKEKMTVSADVEVFTQNNESSVKEKNEKEEFSKPYVFINGAAVLASSVKHEEEKPVYVPRLAVPTEKMVPMAQLRGVHPIYGSWLLNYLPHADRKERLQAFESILELPYSLGPAIRVPFQEELPRGRLACGFLDTRLLDLGLAVPGELIALTPEERRERREAGLEPIYTLTFADKLFRLFQHEFPLVTDLRVWPCWVAGEILRFNGKFNTFIGAKGLQKQEGMIFRHLLRLILLLGEFIDLDLPDGDREEWRKDLSEIIEVLTKTCESADPSGTRQVLEEGLH